MEFTTPIQRNQWINEWLVARGIFIEMYNFKNEGKSKTQDINKAFDMIFPKTVPRTGGGYMATSPNYSMEIKIGEHSHTWYSATIALGVGHRIAELMREQKLKEAAFNIHKIKETAKRRKREVNKA